MPITHRIFVAVQLEQTIQKKLEAVQNHINQYDCDVKWVRPEQIHLTLKFLKSVSPKKLKSIVRDFPPIAEGVNAFEIALSNLRAFPSLQKPQIIWAGISHIDDILLLRKHVEDGFCRLGLKKEKQEFKPHITIGRVRSAKDTNILSQTISDYEFPQSPKQTITTVVLYESLLTSKGPIHKPLASSLLA